MYLYSSYTILHSYAGKFCGATIRCSYSVTMKPSFESFLRDSRVLRKYQLHLLINEENFIIYIAEKCHKVLLEWNQRENSNNQLKGQF